MLLVFYSLLQTKSCVYQCSKKMGHLISLAMLVTILSARTSPLASVISGRRPSERLPKASGKPPTSK